MFEKEAEEYAEGMAKYYASTHEDYIPSQFEKYLRKAVEYGYKKASEWHYVKNGDLPNKELEEKQLLVRVRNYTEDYIFAYYMLDKYYSKNGKRFYSDTDCDYPIDIEDIIAWKEIELPNIKEN